MLYEDLDLTKVLFLRLKPSCMINPVLLLQSEQWRSETRFDDSNGLAKGVEAEFVTCCFSWERKLRSMMKLKKEREEYHIESQDHQQGGPR